MLIVVIALNVVKPALNVVKRERNLSTCVSSKGGKGWFLLLTRFQLHGLRDTEP
jgi:hypothetical protein